MLFYLFNFICEQLPAHIKLRYSSGSLDSEAASRRKKGKCIEGEDELEVEKQGGASQENHLATLDIFAGCGGLSEGLQQSGTFSLVYHFFLFVLGGGGENLFVMHIFHALPDWPFTFAKKKKTTGISSTKWAIEYEEPAGEAFKLNHPESLMLINNCNVILRSVVALR